MLNSFQHLFRIGFRNPLELLFHLHLIKQYLIVLFGRVQSLILFALQISFTMLRATSSFGLCPHTLSQNNTQLFYLAECSRSFYLLCKYHSLCSVLLRVSDCVLTLHKIRKFGMTENKI